MRPNYDLILFNLIISTLTFLLFTNAHEVEVYICHFTLCSSKFTNKEHTNSINQYFSAKSVFPPSYVLRLLINTNMWDY